MGGGCLRTGQQIRRELCLDQAREPKSAPGSLSPGAPWGGPRLQNRAQSPGTVEEGPSERTEG